MAIAPPRVARRLRSAVGLPERAGLLVRGVQDGGPADRAGVEKGDLIVAAGGTPTESVEALYTALDTIPATGGELELTVVRGTDERTVTATFTGAGERAPRTRDAWPSRPHPPRPRRSTPTRARSWPWRTGLRRRLPACV